MELITEEKKGFNKTEVGLIPEDWEVKVLDDVTGLITDGAHLSPPTFERGFPIATVENLKNGKIDIQSCRKISKKDYDQLIRNNCQPLEGDVLLSKDGTIGITITIEEDSEAVLLSSIAIIRPSSKILDSIYLSKVLSSELFYKHLNRVKSGSAIKRIVLRDIRTLNIPLPPTLEEQQAIASTLSDVDELIRSLDRLIQKKEAIKKGTMQQLLTGKKRLPGFDGEWEVKILGDHLKFQTGNPFSSSFFNKKDIGLRLIKNRDLKTDDQVIYYTGNYSDLDIVKDGDLLIGMDGDFIPVIWRKGRALLNQRVGRVNPIKGISIKFLSYYLKKPLEEIQNSTSATTVKHLSHKDVEKIEIKLPPIEEQKAIAQILSDMDRELQTLRQKREKYVQVKQGMMQELLTGKVRLV